MTNKNPQVKEGTLKFLHRCLATTTIPPQPAQVKPLGESLAVLLGDGTESVRIEAAGALGTVMKIVGERAMNPVVEPLDDLRKTKVKEAFEKATVKCKAGAPAPPKPAAAPASKAPVKLQKAPPAKKEPVKEVVEEAPPPSAPNVLVRFPVLRLKTLLIMRRKRNPLLVQRHPRSLHQQRPLPLLNQPEKPPLHQLAPLTPSSTSIPQKTPRASSLN